MLSAKQLLFIVLISAVSWPSLTAAQRAKIIDRLPVEVVANVVWNGQDLELRKVISCDQRRRMHPGTEAERGLRLREVWDQSMHRVFHLLPSREVLIFQLPLVCSQFEKRITATAETFLPLTLWVDSAGAPKVAEQIVSYRYFRENPKHRFQFLNFRMMQAKNGTRINDDQRLIWLVESSGKPDAYFSSVSVAALPKAVWGQMPPLVAELQNRPTGLIDRRFIEKHAPLLLSNCESGADGLGPAQRCVFGQFDDRPFVASASPVSEKSWKVDFADVGVRRYVHLIDAGKLDSSGCNPSFPTCNLFKGTYQLIINGKEYTISKSIPDLVLDAENALLIVPVFRIRTSTYVNPHTAAD